MAIAPDPVLTAAARYAADLYDPPPWNPDNRPKLEPHQIPPDGEWSLWLLEGGRGSGKTEACSRYFAQYMRMNPGTRGRIIAPTFGDAVESCITGPSGLKVLDPEIRFVPSDPGGAKVFWPNGSQALVLGTPAPRDVDRLRAGGNRHIDWWEEMAANAQLEDAWAQAEFGLRLGRWPHSIASTTPRRTAAYRKIRTTEGTAFTRATMFDNPHNPRAFVERMRARYEGTRLGRQELLGLLLDDVEGALWRLDWIDMFRVAAPPATEYRAATVALDPADGTDTGDELATCVAAIGLDNDFYVIESRGCRDKTQVEWITEALHLCRAYNAKLVWERNHGGAALRELIEMVMGQTGIRVPTREVWASTGKTTRAEPVSALYEGGAVRTQGRVRHIGEHLELEEQMTTYTGAKAKPGAKAEKSPDRMDALVWALYDLMGYGTPPGYGGEEEGVVPYSDDGGDVARWG